MNKSLKILSSICTAGILAASIAIPAFAIGQSDFTVMPGNKVNGSAKPAAVEMTAEGLKVTHTGGEFINGGPNAGIIYNTPVNANGFSVEFTVTKAAGNYNKNGGGVDSWISLNLLQKKNDYFNTVDPKKNLGMVTLMRPMRPYWYFDVFELVPQIGQWTDGYRAGAEVKNVTPPSGSGENPCRMKMELKKRSSGLYAYYINGEEVPNAIDFDSDFTTLMDSGKFYFSMGLSCKPFNGNDYTGKIEFIIHKINGNPVKASDVTVVSSNPVSSAGTSSVSKPPESSAVKPPVTVTSSTVTTSSGTASSMSDGSALESRPEENPESEISSAQNDSAVTSEVQTDTDQKKGNGGIIALIVIAAVVVLGGAGASLYFFKFRKPGNKQK